MTHGMHQYSQNVEIMVYTCLSSVGSVVLLLWVLNEETKNCGLRAKNDNNGIDVQHLYVLRQVYGWDRSMAEDQPVYGWDGWPDKILRITVIHGIPVNTISNEY